LAEIARGIAETMTTETRQYLAAMAASPSVRHPSLPTSQHDLALSAAHLLAAKPRASDLGSLPPRYIDPVLPDDQLSLVTTIGQGIGILFVDGALVCAESDYSMEGLKKASPGPSVKLVPGEHKLGFSCHAGDNPITLSTNLTVSAGQHYQVERALVGYTIQLSVKLLPPPNGVN